MCYAKWVQTWSLAIVGGVNGDIIVQIYISYRCYRPSFSSDWHTDTVSMDAV